MDILITILILLASALVLGEVFRYFRLPEVVGELLAGVILGPAVLGIISPSLLFQPISDISLFFIILLIGVESTTELLTLHSKNGFALSVTSFIIPVAGMVLAGTFVFGLSPIVSVAVSLAIGVPSISIISVLVRDRNLTDSQGGQIILASVIISDIIALVGISVIAHIDIAYIVIIEVGAFLAFLLLLDHFIRKNAERVRRMFNALHATEKGEKIIFGSVIVSGLLIAFILRAINLTTVLGAFFAGILISDVVIGKDLHGILIRTLNRIDESFFIPVFFSLAGLQTVIPSPGLVTVLLVLVTISIVAGAALTYFASRRFNGSVSPLVTTSILGGRGSVGVIVATVALSSGIIGNSLYSLSIFGIIIIASILPSMLRFAGTEEKTPS